MSSKKALKQAQKLAFQKHKINALGNKIPLKNNKFFIKKNSKNKK